jgi:hypothetical protein
MWELLQQASEENPIAGNAGHSYLTMRSTQGLIFGVLNIVGNFGELSIPDFCGVIVSIFPSCQDPNMSSFPVLLRNVPRTRHGVQRSSVLAACDCI